MNGTKLFTPIEPRDLAKHYDNHEWLQALGEPEQVDDLAERITDSTARFFILGAAFCAMPIIAALVSAAGQL